MTHTSIRTKLTLAFGGLTLIVFFMVAFALTTSSNANQDFQGFVKGVNARTLASHQLREAVDQRAVSARNIVLADNPTDRERERQTVGKAHTDVQTYLAQLNQLALGSDVSQEAKQLIQEIDRIERSYAPVALDIVDLGLKGQTAEAIRKINEKCRPLLAALVQASEQYNEYSAKHAQELLATASANYENQRNLLIAASLAVLATAIAAGVLITRAVTQPIAQAVAVAQAVASGDLASPIPTHRKDEVGQLLAAMHTMQQGLVRVVASVRQGSEGVANASAEIAQGNHDLSARTEGQASALQQTAASMEQLSATVRNNSDSAVRANELADGASHIARHGGEAVGEVVTTMKDIAHSSQKIADIISVIDGIAFQTNILALNAAVEAARAGEQGRGFAVVATEVRSLAGRSAQAAKEIKQLIHTSLETVERGTRMADTAGGRMGEIVGSIEKVASLIAEISAASREQALGVGQIGEAITQMDQTTQQNAALVEEMAAAASSLKTQSRDLVDVVAEFKLGANDSTRPTPPRLAKPTPSPFQLTHRFA